MHVYIFNDFGTGLFGQSKGIHNVHGQKFRQFRTHLHHILVSTVQICKPMIQNNVEKLRPIHGLSFTQQSNFDMLNNFLRNQLKKAASVPDFSSTTPKN